MQSTYPIGDAIAVVTTWIPQLDSSHQVSIPPTQPAPRCLAAWCVIWSLLKVNRSIGLDGRLALSGRPINPRRLR